MILGKNIQRELRFDFQAPRSSWKPAIDYSEDDVYRNVEWQVWISVNSIIVNEIDPINIPLATFFDLTPP